MVVKKLPALLNADQDQWDLISQRVEELHQKLDSIVNCIGSDAWRIFCKDDLYVPELAKKTKRNLKIKRLSHTSSGDEREKSRL